MSGSVLSSSESRDTFTDLDAFPSKISKEM